MSWRRKVDRRAYFVGPMLPFEKRMEMSRQRALQAAMWYDTGQFTYADIGKRLGVCAQRAGEIISKGYRIRTGARHRARIFKRKYLRAYREWASSARPLRSQ